MNTLQAANPHHPDQRVRTRPNAPRGLVVLLASWALLALLSSGPALAQPENIITMCSLGDAPGGTASQAEDASLIRETLERYAKAVNDRDLDLLLSVYDPRANVNATIGGSKRFYPLGVYARALPEKFKEWDSVSARINSIEVIGLQLAGDRAEVVVKATGRRYFLTGTLEGRATLVKDPWGWKILQDDL